MTFPDMSNPEEDHGHDESLSETADLILTRRECIHDFEEIGGDLGQCRHCGERTRFTTPASSDRIMIRLELLPKHKQLMYVPRSMLDQVILDHFDRWIGQTSTHTCRSGG